MLFLGTLPVGVLDAQAELPVAVSRIKLVVQGGAGTSQMQGAGRTRGKPGSNYRIRHRDGGGWLKRMLYLIV